MSTKVYDAEIEQTGNSLRVFVNEYTEYDSTKLFDRCGLAIRFNVEFVVVDLDGNSLPIRV